MPHSCYFCLFYRDLLRHCCKNLTHWKQRQALVVFVMMETILIIPLLHVMDTLAQWASFIFQCHKVLCCQYTYGRRCCNTLLYVVWYLDFFCACELLWGFKSFTIKSAGGFIIQLFEQLLKKIIIISAKWHQKPKETLKCKKNK